MKKTFLFAFVIASASLVSCGTSGTTSTDSDSVNSGDTGTAMAGSTMDAGMSDTTSTMKISAGPVSDMDKQFMMEAGAGGNTEIAASKVALERSSNDRVKQFANMMITDHQKAGDELKSIASAKSVTLPDSVMPKQHAALEMLRKAPANSFDKAYLAMMSKDHKETVDKFDMAAKKCEDSDVKGFASKTLPVIKMHKESVDSLQKSM